MPIFKGFRENLKSYSPFISYHIKVSSIHETSLPISKVLSPFVLTPLELSPLGDQHTVQNYPSVACSQQTYISTHANHTDEEHYLECFCCHLGQGWVQALNSGIVPLNMVLGHEAKQVVGVGDVNVIQFCGIPDHSWVHMLTLPLVCQIVPICPEAVPRLSSGKLKCNFWREDLFQESNWAVVSLLKTMGMKSIKFRAKTWQKKLTWKSLKWR